MMNVHEIHPDITGTCQSAVRIAQLINLLFLLNVYHIY